MCRMQLPSIQFVHLLIIIIANFNPVRCISDEEGEEDVKVEDIALEQKIVGGSFALEGEFPYQVSLAYDGQFFCGGSILSDNLILTAAHCVDPVRKNGLSNSLQVTAGLRDRSRPDFENQQIKNAQFIYVHENYDNQTMLNDIAIIVLDPESPLQYNHLVQNVSLPKRNQNFEGYATVTGWGDTKYKGKNAAVLRKVTVPIVPIDRCKGLYGDGGKFPVTANHLCAGAVGKDSCQGDSGGPAICRESGWIPTSANSSAWLLCGIVSFGRGCGLTRSPGVYTRVSSYIDWIENTKRKIATRGKCRTDYFYCSSGIGCIPRPFLCDSDPDCGGPEGSEDERECANWQSCLRGSQFRCNDGHCLNKTDVCDGFIDCSDGSDEIKCPNVNKTCGAAEFHCGFRGRCIPDSWKCDNELDCDDGLDEVGCPSEDSTNNSSNGSLVIAALNSPRPCLATQFRCDNGQCISSRFRCDSDNDCSDRSDEKNCQLTDIRCGKYSWRCRTGQCIYHGFKCDGEFDCGDHSDEEGCKL